MKTQLHRCLSIVLLKVLLLSLTHLAVAAQDLSDSNIYLGQEAPGATPQVFAPGFISLENEYEFGSVFSADGTEFYYGVDMGERSEIRYTKLVDGVWHDPILLVHSEEYGYNDPFLSPDENRLYFISDQPLDGTGDSKDIDIWYIERTAESWTKPINVGAPINTSSNEYYISFTDAGTLYFASNVRATESNYFNFDIYYAEPSSGSYKSPIPMSEAVNSSDYEADAFIAYDESYIIFSSQRDDGLGAGDLYISFRKDDGVWTPAQNMGEPFNTPGHELCPFVTRDGKYLIYTSNKDIFWVDAEVVISDFKKQALEN